MEEKKCIWKIESDGYYHSECGRVFSFTASLDEEMQNGFNFCPFCGKEIGEK